jgi:hypothetical protein
MYGIYTKQLQDYLPKSSTKQPKTKKIPKQNQPFNKNWPGLRLYFAFLPPFP